MAKYDIGDLVRATGTFRDLDEVLVDPDTVTFKSKAPSGAVVSRTYPTDVTKESVGVYHSDWSLNETGTWYLRIESTGAAQAAEEITISVARSVFA